MCYTAGIYIYIVSPGGGKATVDCQNMQCYFIVKMWESERQLIFMREQRNKDLLSYLGANTVYSIIRTDKTTCLFYCEKGPNLAICLAELARLKFKC